MLSDAEMLEIAEQYMSFKSDDQYELLVDKKTVLIKSYGNIYCHYTMQNIKTGIFSNHLISAPFLIEKETGILVTFGSAYSLEHYIKAYEEGTLMPSLDSYWYSNDESYSHKYLP